MKTINRNEIKKVLVELIEKTKCTFSAIMSHLKTHNIEIYNYLKEEVSRINNSGSISEVIYLIINDMLEPPKCIDCNETYAEFKDFERNYQYSEGRCAKCNHKYSATKTRLVLESKSKEELKEISKRTVESNRQNRQEKIEKLLSEEVFITRIEVKDILIKLFKDKPNSIKAIDKILLSKYPEVYKFFHQESNRLHIHNKGQIAYMIINDLSEIPLCIDCKKEPCNFKGYKLGFSERCTKCGLKYGASATAQKLLEKNGDSNPAHAPGAQQKRIETNLQVRGVAFPMQSSEVLAKANETFVKNGGRGFANPEYVERMDETMRIRTGKGLYQYNGDKERIKRMQTNYFEKHGETCWSKTKFARQYLHNLNLTEDIITNVKNFLLKYDFELISEYYNAGTPITIRHIPCGTEWTISCYNQFQTGSIIPLCRHCNPHIGTGVSSQEYMISEALKKEFPGINIVNNTRTLIDSYKEIDIYLPDHNLAIEFCGLYWHSSNDCNNLQKPKLESYHKDKFLTCYNKGIRLITIFEDEPLDQIIEYVIKIIKKEEKITIEDLEEFDHSGEKCYLLDNRYTSYNFFPLKEQFEMIKFIPAIPWFWEVHDHEFLRYDEFKESYCGENENPFNISKQFGFNWIYDCGYQVLRLKK